MAQAPFTPLVIDGQERPGGNSETFEIRTPQTGVLVGTVAAATSQDCRDAIEAAAKAYKTWEKTRVIERRQIYNKALELLGTEHWGNLLAKTSRDELAFTESWSGYDVFLGKGYIQTGIAVEEKLRGEFYPAAHVPGGMVYVQPRAKGVL
jgi:acyl-CoA reductase-like NAD-dependent aldehyde dehydrogenase